MDRPHVAMIGEGGQLVYEEADDFDDGEGDTDGEQQEEGGIDIISVIEGMGSLFHEHHDTIVKWPWKLFCEKWGRLIRYSADEEVKERKRRIERAGRAGGLDYEETYA